MPILDVEIVGDYDPDHGVALKIADRAAVVLKADIGQVWVKLRHVPRERYAENGRGDPCPDQPVFITVTKGVLQDVEELRVEAEQLTRAVAEAVGRPAENVHVIYEPSATRRIAFGGKLVE
ncbi:MAG: hypothetical protein IH944_02260 [Armatimonadetes bacterium]|nr:hypothetical protein [Armatimonadota bacterium]